MSHVVDLRCDLNPSRLLARMRIAGERVTYVMPDNLVEFRCREHPEAKARGMNVYHLFNVAGEFIRSEERVD